MDRCGAVFAVAVALAEDFRRETTTPVYHLPMAVSSSFLRNAEAAPADVQSIRRPIVGCTGQINRSYDWDLIEEIRQRIDRVFGRPNVHWLGPRPHGLLPDYLNAFDVGLNPLLMSHHADRRSPLRLFDYMSTAKPIISTAIREAFEHQEHLLIASSAEECVDLLREVLAGRIAVDAEARRLYIQGQTWERRAEHLLEGMMALIHPVTGKPAGRDSSG